ncbi:amidase family protein [Planococcus sp. ISL-109]|uniref:amidase family protein n=1 Tax=Planococcus sp. ISL-109 TaxID=2819166 RepID=UPI001BE522CF|nr:amidase family protein [Planococcus sp. ISL-109]MBT2583265.1 amidase [Planococcus sp. ISL-109]
MDMKTYLTLDATAMAELINSEQVSPKELLELSFRRLEAVDPALHAFTATRRERAMEDAVNRRNGIFSGVPMALKNISQALAGERLSAGSKLLEDFRPAQDSHFVSRLKAAGLISVGHTNTPEFGLKNISEPELFGPTRNPWNVQHSPGGSSGGAAAAVASGIVPVAGASDGGGSIRIPASFTGLFGLKPTRGRTPVGPGAGRQWQGASIDFALSRTVQDSAALLDVLQVVQPEAAFQAPLFPGKYTEQLEQDFAAPLTIAFSVESPVGTVVSEEAKKAVLKTVRWLEGQGHRVEEVTPGIDGIQLMREYYLMNSGEMALLRMNLEKSLGRRLTEDDMEIESWLLASAGTQVSAAEYSASLAAWDAAAAKTAALHERFDFYITPATAHAAPEIGELSHSPDSRRRLLEAFGKASDPADQQELIYAMFLPSLSYTPFTQLANLTGQPAMSLPLHVTARNLPLGVQVMAQKGEEHRLLQLAKQFEQSDLWVGQNGNPFFE